MPVRAWFGRLRTFFGRPRPSRRRTLAPRRVWFRPFLEPLEDRTLLSVTAFARGDDFEGGGGGDGPEILRPTHLVFGTPPATTTAGQTFPVTVLVEDANNQVVTSDASLVTVTLRGPGTFSTGSTTARVAAGSGVASFGGLQIDRAGNYSLDAGDGALTSPSPAAFTVIPAAAGSLVVAGFSSPTTAGVAHSFTVTALDAFDNLATGYAGTVAFTSDDPQAALPGPVTFAAADAGVKTVTATLDTAGTHSLTATDTQFASHTDTHSVRVDPAPASQFVVTGLPPAADAGDLLSFTVTAEDPFHNTDTNFNGRVTLASSDPAALLSGGPTLTGGVGTFTVLFPGGGRGKTVTVSAPADKRLTATAGVNLSSILFPSGSVFVPSEGVPFTGEVADFTTAFSADASAFTAEISWGDGTFSAGTVVAEGDKKFEVFGSHDYLGSTTFLADVTISAASHHAREQSAPSGVIVLNFGEDAALEPGFGFVRTAPGAHTAETFSAGIAADLSDPANTDQILTLFVARYSHNPEPTVVNGAAFFDARATGTDLSATMTVTFSLAGVSGFNPRLLFFNAATGSYDPVRDPQGNPVTAAGLAAGQVFHVVFDVGSLPELVSLTGTVFVIAVDAQDTTVQQLAIAFASSGAGPAVGPHSPGGGVGVERTDAVGTRGKTQPDGAGGEGDESAARPALADLPAPPSLFSPRERLLIVTPSQSSITTLTEDDDPLPSAKPEEPEALRRPPHCPVAPQDTRAAVVHALFAGFGPAARSVDEWPEVRPLPVGWPGPAEMRDGEGTATSMTEDVWTDLFAGDWRAPARTDFDTPGGGAGPGMMLGGLALALATENVSTRSRFRFAQGRPSRET